MTRESQNRAAQARKQRAQNRAALARLTFAVQARNQRALEAYPCCQSCGRQLSAAQVAARQSRHDPGEDFYGCQMPEILPS